MAVASLLVIPGSTMIASEPNVKPVGLVMSEASESLGKQYWTCPGCSTNENKVLEALQERGISDKNALAVLMGNIKQESKFQTTICEGGQKTGYYGCRWGGFGLIQWTTSHRYHGLGRTANKHGLNPNSMEAQLKWLFEEREWRKVEDRFKTPGKTIAYYMNVAYRWLGWGVHGSRTHYANQYLNYFHSA